MRVDHAADQPHGATGATACAECIAGTYSGWEGVWGGTGGVGSEEMRWGASAFFHHGQQRGHIALQDTLHPLNIQCNNLALTCHEARIGKC
jgi:hypothetical protein